MNIIRYKTGEDVLVGDHITYNGAPARIVIVADQEQTYGGFIRDDWRFVGAVLVLFENGAHLVLSRSEEDEHLMFVARC
jgi:hypothetical protein